MYQDFHLMLLGPLRFCREQLKHRPPLYYSDLSKLIDKQGDWLTVLKTAPWLITQALHEIYGRPAIVLVDEYEAPLNDAMKCNYLAPASRFFETMFSRLLKVNEF
jgi:hypothetical protein